MTIRAIMLTVLAAALATAGGCLKSEAMSPGQMDELWRPEASVWDEAVPSAPDEGGAMPTRRFVVAYEPSAVWSAIRLHEWIRDYPRREPSGTTTLHVSEQHARSATVLMLELAESVKEMAEAIEDAELDRLHDRRWAMATARLVRRVHEIFRAADPTLPGRTPLEVDDTAAWAVVPLLEALTRSLADGDDRLEPVEVSERMRQTERLIQRIFLTTVFRIAGRTLPTEALDEILLVQRQQYGQRALDNTATLLLWHMHVTPMQFAPLPETAEGMANWADSTIGVMRYMRELSEQWSNVDYLALELRKLEGRTVTGLEFAVRPGRQVALRNIDFFAPEVYFSGHGRVVVRRSGFGSGGEGEIISTIFETDDAGSIDMRFRGLVFFLVRLFALPLEDSSFEQLQIRRLRGADNEEIVEVDLLLKALNAGKGDPRRLVRVVNTQRPVLREREDLPPQLMGRTQKTQFFYANDRRMYRYERESFSRPQLWRK